MALFPVGLNKILRVCNTKIISQMFIAPCNPKCLAVGCNLSATAGRAEEGWCSILGRYAKNSRR